jgi:hypothetical protein
VEASREQEGREHEHSENHEADDDHYFTWQVAADRCDGEHYRAERAKDRPIGEETEGHCQAQAPHVGRRLSSKDDLLNLPDVIGDTCRARRQPR